MSLPEALTHIHPAVDTACGGCFPSAPGCAKGLGMPCAEPRLSGDAAQLERALASLRSVVDPEHGGNLVELQLVKSLRVQDGETELTVTFPRGCGATRLMAEDAFQALRRALPDTDVYVSHAA